MSNFFERADILHESHLMSSPLNRSIETYLSNIKIYENASLVYDNFLLNHLMNEYSEYFFQLKLVSLNFTNSINLLDNCFENKSFYINLKEFKSLIIENNIKNIYNIYANSIIYKSIV